MTVWEKRASLSLEISRGEKHLIFSRGIAYHSAPHDFARIPKDYIRRVWVLKSSLQDFLSLGVDPLEKIIAYSFRCKIAGEFKVLKRGMISLHIKKKKRRLMKRSDLPEEAINTEKNQSPAR
jgi:hypothetical protein